jgi:KaiC/GvpD/RAD55 family RecA-like ATPase
MNTLRTLQDWFDRLLPGVLPIPSTTLLSGPGGSSKPLIGNIIVVARLRQGGSVVFMPLQYPDHSFIASSLKNIAQLDLNEYKERCAFVELEATIEAMTEPEDNRFRANTVKPVMWTEALAMARAMVPEQGPGILIFVSAVNLLLFSPTYGAAILETMKAATQSEQSYSYLFSASTTAEEIAEWETVLDNLIMTGSTRRPFQLYMQIKRIKGAPFLTEEILAPFSADLLIGVKEIAAYSRKRVTPLVSKLWMRRRWDGLRRLMARDWLVISKRLRNSVQMV